MSRVNLPSGQIVTYGYDPVGRRASRTVSSNAGASPVTTNFVYDGADVVVDQNNDNPVEYLNGPGIDNKPRLLTSTSSLTFLHDHLNTTIALTSDAAGVVERQHYEPFGQSSGSSLTRYDYTGRERDDMTGLMYYRARWYDPEVGRFISEDPVGFRGGDTNLYLYAGNNPTGFSDPTGLWSPEAHREIIRRAFKGCLSDAQVDQLIKASGYMDGVLNGGAWMEKFAYQHGMRAPDQSVDEARNLANGFMRDEMNAARWAQSEMHRRHPLLGGGISAGLPRFGNALHTITDMFSPVHQGFQIWHGPPTPTGITPIDLYRAKKYADYARRHAAQETLDVLLKDQARLDQIIKAARDAFFDTFGKNACDCPEY